MKTKRAFRTGDFLNTTFFYKVKTKVIFRKFRDTGEVIALFPEEPGTLDIDTCSSYMHNGQHASASVRLIDITDPATPEEYADLKRELENLSPEPYDLEVRKRFSIAMYVARKEALKPYTSPAPNIRV